jgi:hypothetical protein
MTDLHIPRHWRYRLLGVLDAPDSDENLRFLLAWSTAEGGTAQYNPLNTTYGLPGSSNYNSVGVKNYSSPLEGIVAQALTLDHTNYDVLVKTLRAGTHTAEEIVSLCSAAIKTWGTSPQLILDVLKSI